MYFWIPALLGAAAVLYAADDPRLALTLKAQSDFDRVELAAVPRLADAGACVQSQAAEIPVATLEDAPLLHYRKGYCALVESLITRNSAGFMAAAGEFDQAAATGAARSRNDKGPAEPVSSGLRVIATLARLEAGADEASLARGREELTAALAALACPASVMPAASCQDLLAAGRQWLGWIELRRGDPNRAVTALAGSPTSGWRFLAAGRSAFHYRLYQDSVSQFRMAIEAWDRDRKQAAATLAQRLLPAPEFARTYTELGGAQLLAGDAAGAIASLDEAVRLQPADARAFFLRARAREAAGQSAQAEADYNLASRTAFAVAPDLASGEAHLYRGILFFRRKDFNRAEEQFESALSSAAPEATRADATAWRHLAAVAGGACGSERDYLERSLGAVSPFFPKAEARAAMASCPSTVTAVTMPAPAPGSK
jgi:tetratricopeptide (TPR) repeat protein